jgi:hypothetical protein
MHFPSVQRSFVNEELGNTLVWVAIDWPIGGHYTEYVITKWCYTVVNGRKRVLAKGI